MLSSRTFRSVNARVRILTWFLAALVLFFFLWRPLTTSRDDMLKCCLQASNERAGADGTRITYTLTNTACDPLIIRYGYWPHQHLSLVFYSSLGRKKCELRYQDLVSIKNEDLFIALQPGESYSGDLFPYRLFQSKSLQPLIGRHKVRALFDFKGRTIESDIIDIDLVRPE